MSGRGFWQAFYAETNDRVRWMAHDASDRAALYRTLDEIRALPTGPREVKSA